MKLINRSIPVQELRPEAAVLRDAFPWPSILPELDKLIARSAVTKNSAECLSLAEEMEALILSAYKQEYDKKQSQDSQDSQSGQGQDSQSGQGQDSQSGQGQDSQSGQGQDSQKPLTKEEQKRAASLKKKLDKAINKIAKEQVGVDRRGFVIFSSPEYGIRAAAHVLTAYYIRHDKDTLAKIVRRFSTSDQKDYTVFLSHHMKLGVNKPFHVLERLPELMRCMARYECGRWLPKRMFVGYDIASASYRLGKEER